MKKIKSGGGWPAIKYSITQARQSGGIFKFFEAMRSRNACKTCALGMGGQRGGMVDESGRFPEVCKKSMQAMSADMQPAIPTIIFAQHALDELSKLTPRELENLGRLADPLYAGPGDTHYKSITWDDALELCATRLKMTDPNRNFFYVSGRSSNEAGFLLQLFARLYGTNHVNNCSYFCHQASGVGLTSALGSGTATVVLEDLARCDLLFLIGGNPASNHPRLMRQLMNLRRRGGKVIVVNPMVETGLVRFNVPSDLGSLLFGTEIASQYIQPHIGGDLALLLGIAKRVDELGALDEGFLHHATEGWEAFRDQIRATSWKKIESSSGVSIADIFLAATSYSESNASIFAWTMGITHHTHGSDNVRAIANLALMRGMVGKKGAGFLPIRGHSNVQGIGSVGVTPKLKQALFERLRNFYGIDLPETPGLDTLGCLQAAAEGAMQNGWCLGGNLFGASPDAAFAQQAIGRMDFMAYFSTTMNTGHVLGRAKETLILPMLVRDEESQPTSQESMFSFVRLSDGGPRRLQGPRSEVETIAAIAGRVLGNGGPIDWSSMVEHRTIREAIARVVPGYESLARIDDTRHEFQIAGRTFHTPRFPTTSGRAKFHVLPMASAEPDAGTLCLMTIRSEGQFNTVVYEEEDIYRNQDRRDVILMNESDIARLGLTADQRVVVHSVCGEMNNILVRPFPIRAGNAAMYFPEANVLIPTDADPESRTPAYKSVRVKITPTEPQALSCADSRNVVDCESP